MLSNTFCTCRLWEESAQLAPAQPRNVMKMNTVSSILAVVEHTGLTMVLPELPVVQKPSDGLVGVSLVDPTSSRQVGLLWHRENYLCWASRAFMAVARGAVERFPHLTPTEQGTATS